MIYIIWPILSVLTYIFGRLLIIKVTPELGWHLFDRYVLISFCAFPFVAWAMLLVYVYNNTKDRLAKW